MPEASKIHCLQAYKQLISGFITYVQDTNAYMSLMLNIKQLASTLVGTISRRDATFPVH
jgi:hypothetical protein